MLFRRAGEGVCTFIITLVRKCQIGRRKQKGNGLHTSSFLALETISRTTPLKSLPSGNPELPWITHIQMPPTGVRVRD